MRIRNETFLTFSPIVGRVRYPAFSLTLVVKGTYAITPGGTLSPLPAADQPQPAAASVEELAPGLRTRRPSDIAYYKPLGEILVRGSAHAPGGLPAKSVDVSIRVGEAIRKTLRVHGPRQWEGDEEGNFVPSKPEPFTSMPLVYEAAFGGPAVPANPVGAGGPRGDSLEPAHPDQGFPPRIEYPDHPMRAIGDAPPIAGFEPKEPEWEPRRTHFGATGAAWRQTRAPWLPEDLSWRFFCEGAEDQALKSGFFEGTETLSFENMHPELPTLTCTLPTQRVRCVVAGTLQDIPFVREVPTNLDTIYADLEEGRVTLVWRGLVEVDGPECGCIEDILIDVEDMTAPPLSADALETKLADLIATPTAARKNAAESEAAVTKMLEDALSELRQAGAPKEIMDIIDSGKPPLDMLTDLQTTLRRILKDAGVDLPPTV